MSDTGQLIQIAGTIASIYTGNPAWALAANAIAVTYFPPEGPGIEGPRLNDLKVQSSKYGAPIPIVYGRARVSGNILWIKGNKLIERRVVTEEGGKGGGGGQEIVTYEYYASFAVSVCEGEIDSIRRIWADNVLLYDKGTGSDIFSILGTQQISDRITVYTGTSTQEPNTLIEADVGTAPAYRGLAYVVFDALPLKKYGNRIPNMTFEVVNGSNAGELLSSHTTTVTLSSSGFDGFFTKMIDSAGRGFIVMPQYTNSYANSNHKGSILHPDGRQETKATVSLGYNRGYHIAGNPHAKSEGDVIYVPKTTSSGLTTIISVWNKDANAFTKTAYYSTSVAMGAECFTVVRGSYIAMVDVNNTNERIYVAPYPSGSSTTPTPAVVLCTQNSLGSGNFESVSHDGATLWLATDANEFYSFSLADNSLISTLTTNRVYDQIRYDDYAGKLHGQLNGRFYEINTSTGGDTLILNTGLTEKQCGAWDIRGDLLHLCENPDYPTTTGTRRYYRLNSVTAANVNLSDVLSDLCTRSGLTAGEIDVTGISDTVAGYVHTKQAPAKADLETLSLAYQFDAVESGYKVKFVSRGGASALTLTNDDLAAHEYGQDRPDELIQMRERDIAIPYRVETAFIDIDRDYDPGSQYAERLVTSAVGIEQTQLAVLLSAAQAAAISEILLWRRWLERNSFEFQLPYKYSYLEPTDVITLNLDEGTFKVRLVETSTGAPGLMKCKAVLELPEIYTSAAAGEAGTPLTATVGYLADTTLNFLDMPILRDADDDAGYYYACGPELGSTWEGAAIFQSNDDGESYFQIDAAIEESVQGVCTTTLATGEWLVFDRVNTVTVRLTNTSNTLSSASEINVLNGSNLCAIGNTGRWEILKFANATLGSNPGEYTLDTFIRGYRGTEQHMGSHTSSDKFVMLSSTTTQRFNPGADLIGVNRTYKPVTFGKNLIGTDSQTFTNYGIGLKPYAPVNIKGSRDGSNNLTITWNRRTRLGGEWRDLVGATLGETTESYEIEILTAGSPDVVRTLTATSESKSYTAAQQTTDFGSAQSSVSVRIYQMSATFGRGYAGSATI